MKVDMIAHEMFLKTAKLPSSIRKIFEIIGVKVKGPSSAIARAVGDIDGEAVTSTFTITPQSRVFQISSPSDGQSVTYTLYSTTNGIIDGPLESGNVVLNVANSEGGAGLKWSNLVLVEGSLAIEEGVFGSVNVTKEISLTNGPVVQGSVQVLIPNSGGAYTEVDSLLSTSADGGKVFEVVYDDNFNAKVVFGDGITGRIPDAGSEYYIVYRVGGGQRGNSPTRAVESSVVSVEGDTLNIYNSIPFTGGFDAETLEHAKKYAQLVFRQQDRLVSLADYIGFANTFRDSTGASGKATAATRKAYSSANIVDVYLLQKASDTQLQKASLSFKQAMLQGMEPMKMLTDEIVIVDGLVRTVDLDIKITLERKFQKAETAIKGRIARVIYNYFNVDNREFGESFYPDDIAREIFTGVEEVRIAEVTNFPQVVNLEFNEILQLNNFTINMNYV